MFFQNNNPSISKPEPQHRKKTVVAQNIAMYDLVVFSHLRWNFVYQRPQHIISRMSKEYRTLFIEEPIPYIEDEKYEYDLEHVLPTVDVLRPKVSSISEIATILIKLNLTNVKIAWFYSAAFSGLLSTLKANTIIYDCMDELSLFKGADSNLVMQEGELMRKADIIFTGGKSLYESKSASSDKVYCFPSSVDISHFQKAQNGLEIPQDIANIKGPIVGYIGVIDERINLEILEGIAKMQPGFSFVMVGPVVKIDENDLPRTANIHYLGMKSYDSLPQYLKAIDITMMPFALNDSTKYISPTKTLEYMAAGKPIISTPIKDVVRDYSDSVYIVSTVREFSEALEKINLSPVNNYISQYQDILLKTSWNHTSEQMLHLIQN
ncbi:glycosyltransferase [Aequorivita capsosiphonis]|uniref:glycosyltransferase n=1 Tax=Aequorivita capsosiphonis TaxID=487317 RepID=UPI000424FDA8|nr:glycosyltransferase [Aequorivita capsosiphonis]